MKLHQLRYLCEIVRQGLNFSNAAEVLNTTQPAISKQVKLLEEELGIDIFVRNGSRIVEITEPGRQIFNIATFILQEAESVRGAAQEFIKGDTGRLNVAATFTFARYILPSVFQKFVTRYPEVELNLMQGSPSHVSKLIVTGEADVALTTPPTEPFPEIVQIEYRKLPRALILPRGHVLLKEAQITLKMLSRHPLITLDASSQGQSKMRDMFEKSGLKPRIVFAGVDVDVVKAFVEAGLGIAILPAVSYTPKRDPDLRVIDVNHLFEPHKGCLAIRKNHYLRGFTFEFIKMLAPHIDRRVIENALTSARAMS